MTRSPFSQEVCEILQVMIAPGGRMRLSPQVEEAQLRFLWGEEVDPRKRFESIKNILRRHEEDIKRFAKVQTASLEQRGERFSDDWYQREDYRRMWVVHNFPMNVCKVQMALLELVRAEQLKSDIVVIDIGVGAGNAPIALFDFLIAWSNACLLFDLEMPIRSVQYQGYDKHPAWLETAQQVVNAYQQVVQSRIQQIGEQNPAADSLQKISQWIGDCLFVNLDLQRKVPPTPSQPTLLIACNLLSELNEDGKRNLMQLMDTLVEGSSAIIIEPGDSNRAPGLFRWRREFMQRYSNWSIVAPCGQEFGRTLPQCCDSCWNLKRDTFHQNQLYKRFREISNQLSPDRRSMDEYENNLLSQSYSIFTKVNQTTSEELPTIQVHNGVSYVRSRYIGTYHRDGTDMLKLCPFPVAEQGGNQLQVSRQPGVVVPRLKYGEMITIACKPNPSVHREPHHYTLNTSVEEPVMRLSASSASPALSFLPHYTERTRAAIDEIAYRFFGFEKMRDFQHKVLERVLRGHSILAIAATGGGKSECFILPALLLPGITIVIAPLKSLMQDQYEQRLMNRYGFGDLATFINSDVPFIEREERLQKLSKGYYKIVYFTPEQLQRDYILAALQEAHRKVGVRYLALDEAHCISQWGHDFRPAYLNIVYRLHAAGIQPLPVRIALTATASPKVREDVCRELHLDPKPLEEGGDLYVHSSNRPELNFIVKVVDSHSDKVDDMLQRLRNLDPQTDAAIIFLPHTGGDPNKMNFKSLNKEKSKNSSQVVKFASYLEQELEERVCIYHSKMEDETNPEEELRDEESELGDLRGRSRRREQEKFIQGERRIMVATKGFGMGIDKPNIRLVLHRTPPVNLEAYIQEAGRAGRDGDFADVVLYYANKTNEEYCSDKEIQDEECRSDKEIQEFFISEKYIKRQDVEAMCEFLKQVSRKVNGAIYFTNDEVVEFFERRGFEWPEFPPDKDFTEYPEEHRQILERGLLYVQKRDYIGRILSAMYSFRPDGQALLERVQEVGIRIKNLKTLNTVKIIQSNAYFGKIFREKGLTAQELEKLIGFAADPENDEGIIPLARRIGCSLYETRAILQDIKLTEPKQPLLMFDGIFPPKYGPASGKISLQQWRDYAGAYRMASDFEAHKRAEKRRNSTQLIGELKHRYQQPKSDIAQTIISQFKHHGMVGKMIRDNINENQLVFQNIQLYVRIVDNQELPDNAEILYFRDIISEIINKNPTARREYEMLRGNFDAQRELIIRNHMGSHFEAGFYTNPKIRLVALHQNGDIITMLVFKSLPGMSPSLDDYFGWNECPSPRGWEVELSPIFQSEERLAQAIEAFMQEHDQRQQDDWSSYEYLLNDYIGSNSEGKGNCLRAVMLGYLKTNEIVIGDNCYSCSRCVPDENFSTDLQQRRSVIRTLEQGITELLNTIENFYKDKLIENEKLDQLWKLTDYERSAGRNVQPYLQGWSGRVLTDTPEHKSVHLLRLDAMYRGHWEMRDDEYRQHLQRLLGLCSPDELRQIEHLYAHYARHTSTDVEGLRIVAAFYRKLERYQEELELLQTLKEYAPSYELFERILWIYEQLGVNTPERTQPLHLECARHAPDPERAAEHYAQTQVVDTHNAVLEECIYIFDKRYPESAARALRLLQVYLNQDKTLTLDQATDLAETWLQMRDRHNLSTESHLDQAVREKIAHRVADALTVLDSHRLLATLKLLERYEAPEAFIRAMEVAVQSPDEVVLSYVCEHAGSLGDCGIPLLQSVAHCGHESVRRCAYTALAQIASAQALQTLAQGLADTSEALRLYVLDLLFRAGRQAEVASALQNDSAQVRAYAYELLRQFPGDYKYQHIKQAALLQEEAIQQRALCDLVAAGRDDLITEIINTSEFRFAKEALLYLGSKGNTQAVEQAIKNADPAIRKLAFWFLAHRINSDVTRLAEHLAVDESSSVRQIVCRYAVRKKMMSVLHNYLHDENRNIRKVATLGIARIGTRSDHLTLMPLLNDHSRDIARVAYETIRTVDYTELQHLYPLLEVVDQHGFVNQLLQEMSSSPEQAVVCYTAMLKHSNERISQEGKKYLQQLDVPIAKRILKQPEHIEVKPFVYINNSQNNCAQLVLYDSEPYKYKGVLTLNQKTNKLFTDWKVGEVGIGIFARKAWYMLPFTRIGLPYSVIHKVRAVQALRDQVTMSFSGRFEKTGDGGSVQFGNVTIFVPPRLASGLEAGKNIRGLAVLSWDSEKAVAIWEAITV